MRPNNKDLLISFADSHGNITYELFIHTWMNVP